MEVADARKRMALEDENAKLKKHLAEQMMGFATLHEMLSKIASEAWLKEIMTFAGHSSIQMTMERYGHLFPSPDHQKAMAMVEAKLLG